jgi:hypothetical protein
MSPAQVAVAEKNRRINNKLTKWGNRKYTGTKRAGRRKKRKTIKKNKRKKRTQKKNKRKNKKSKRKTRK